jgi:ribosomal protein L4
MTIKEIFTEFAKTFSKKIDKEYHIKIQLEFTDIAINNCWQVEAKDGSVFIYNEHKIEPEETYILTSETLNKLYNNELAPFMAFAKESNEIPAPIEPKNILDEKTYNEKMKNEEKNQYW